MTHFSRIGEGLWQEWDGSFYEPLDPSNVVFYTIDHVDLDHDVVRRSLASYLQRSGIVDGLGGGYRAIENGRITQGYAGILDGEDLFTACMQNGETFYGDIANDVQPVTWVEVSDDE